MNKIYRSVDDVEKNTMGTGDGGGGGSVGYASPGCVLQNHLAYPVPYGTLQITTYSSKVVNFYSTREKSISIYIYTYIIYTCIVARVV